MKRITTSLFLGFALTHNVIAAPFRVGLVLDKGGRDDKSFNAAAFKGASEAKEKLGIQLKVVEASDDTAIEPAMRTFAQHKYDLIIGIGFAQASATTKVAKSFPGLRFLVVDADVKLPNVRSVFFNEHEGSFLVGAIAALTSKSHQVGFVGGMDVPLIRRFEMGFKAGVANIDPKAKVVSNYIGATSDAWKNPTKAKELALSQYQRGADVVYAVAGASGVGVFDAAEEKKLFAIGVDSNQNWVKPGRVLTSMLKRVDLAVYEGIAAAQKGQFETGRVDMGLVENGVDFSLDEHNRPLLPADVLKKVEALRQGIVTKQIKVPDYYQTQITKKS